MEDLSKWSPQLRASYAKAMREAKATEDRVRAEYETRIKSLTQQATSLRDGWTDAMAKKEAVSRELVEVQNAYGDLVDYMDLMGSPAWDGLDAKRNMLEYRISRFREAEGVTQRERNPMPTQYEPRQIPLWDGV